MAPRPQALVSLLAALVWAPSARADSPHVTVGSLSVKVDPASASVVVEDGATHATSAIDLAKDEIDPSAATAVKVDVGDGRSVVHVRVPSSKRRAVAWEAVIAAHSPPVLWSGVTGLAHGEEGEYAGTALVIEPREGGASYVVIGDVREDLGICGQTRTLLAPKVLDPKTLELRGASMQQLEGDRLDDADEVVASPLHRPADAPLARLLVATGASSAIGAPGALTDGDLRTTWSESRPGDGHGEFVSFTAPSAVPITRFAITVAPSDPPAHGAGPRSFYLAARDRVLHVTLPEDAWLHPGESYEVPLVEPLRTSCLSLVLDKAYVRPDGARRDVTVAELVAYSSFDAPGATLDSVAKALAGGGERAETAKAVLERAGDPGLAAAAKAFPSLDASGRALAIDAAIGAGTCDASGPLLIAAMHDPDAEVARKGREKIARCGKAATGALVAAVSGTDGATRAAAAPMLASIAPSAALEPLTAALADGTATTRATVRAALTRAARGAKEETLASLLARAPSHPDGRLELLRALSDELSRVALQADAAIASVATNDAPMRTRYLLVTPLAALAKAKDASATARLAALLASDPDPAVRAHAADEAAGVEALTPTLATCLADESPRVREAALHALTHASAPPTAAVVDRLAHDEWTFVRAAAAGTLAAAPPGREVDGALTNALKDDSSSVRELAIHTLAAHGATSALPAIRARLGENDEALEVRIAAVRAVTALCDRGAVDALTALATRAPLPMASDTEIALGIEAAVALGSVHPGDLAARLRPLLAKDARAEVRAAAERALATPPSCR